MRFVKKAFLVAVIWAPLWGGVLPASGQGFGMLSQPVPEKKSYPSLSAEGGRFVFGQISESSRDQFMLDSLTGRLWRIGETGAVGIFLQPVPYRTEKGEYRMMPDEIPGPEPATEKPGSTP